MIEFIGNTEEELKSIFENRTKKETFNYIIKMLDTDKDLKNDEIEFILKICEIKDITIEEIEEYFESHEITKK